MKYLPFKLLHEREEFWRALSSQELKWKDLLGLVAFIAFACGLYGAVLAGWRSPRLALYVAIKLPALFLGTTVIVAVFNWLSATIMGSGLTFRSTIFVVLASMTIGCWILLGLVPVALFFLLSGVSYSGTHSELQYAHNSILMVHITILAIAGLAGNAALLKGLRSVVTARCPVNALLIWLIAMCFAARYVGKLKANNLFKRQGGIKVWFFILTIVTLQMATCMRPMLGRSERGWWTTEKKFFLSHFGSTFKNRSE